jgi:tRNA(Ile)-lysidine synthase
MTHKFFENGDRVMLAVSGGMDSMAMCHFFDILKKTIRLDIAIIHLNHSLRGTESDKDEIFVKQYAERWNYPFFSKKVDVYRKALSSKISIEEAARNLRYDYLESIAEKHRYNKICTAHHGSDQAETIMMRIIKGTGWSGLSGIREKRGSFIRPLLIFTKEEITSYVKDRKIKYVEDQSNRDKSFLRNRVRHDLIPLLKRRFDPQIEKHLVQLGYIAEDTRTFMSKLAGTHFSSVCRLSEGKIVLEIKAFNRYLRAQRQAIIEFLFEEHFGLKLQFTDYQNLFDLIEKKQSGKRILLDTIECLKASSQVIFQIKRKQKKAPFRFEIETDRSYFFKNPDLSFHCKVMANSPALNKEFGRRSEVEFIDAEKISGNLVMRNWRPGDKFVPLGMNGFKKLSDFFIDEKISIREKGQIPILAEKKGRNENIIWVCGHRIDDRYKVDNTTKILLKLKCERYEKNL